MKVQCNVKPNAPCTKWCYHAVPHDKNKKCDKPCPIFENKCEEVKDGRKG